MKKDKKRIRNKLMLDKSLPVGKVISMNKLLKLTQGLEVWVECTGDGMYMPINKDLMLKRLKIDWDKYKEKNHWVRVTANFGLNSAHNCIHVAFTIKPKKKVKPINKKKNAKSKTIHSKSKRNKRGSNH